MISSLALSDTVLALASIFSVCLMAQQKTIARLHRLSSFMALLGFFLMALAAGIGSLRYGVSPAWTGSHIIMTNIATFSAPPLISAALCLGVTTSVWRVRVWFAFILGLGLLFELASYYRVANLYRDILMALSLIVCLLFTLRSQLKLGIKIITLTAISSYFIGGLVIGNQGTLLGCLRLDLFRYFIGLGNLLLSSSLFFILRKHQLQHES